MARFTYDGLTVGAAGLDGMGRDRIRRIVEAGADAAVEHMRERIDEMHRIEGDMRDGVAKGQYRETLGGGSMDVYPQGTDRKGVDNALKAFVINYGRGGTRKRKSKLGDHFIDRDTAAEEIVLAAMQRETEAVMAEIAGT